MSDLRKSTVQLSTLKNHHAVPLPLKMAELPVERLDAFVQPFAHIGPLKVVVGRRVEKRWGMLITCPTTRAIYIEVVHTLSTDSSIMGLRNFAAHRGTSKTIYSDRGTFFNGASRELGDMAAKFSQDDLIKEFGGTETTWKFNPPASPQLGPPHRHRQVEPDCDSTASQALRRSVTELSNRDRHHKFSATDACFSRQRVPIRAHS